MYIPSWERSHMPTFPVCGGICFLVLWEGKPFLKTECQGHFHCRKLPSSWKNPMRNMSEPPFSDAAMDTLETSLQTPATGSASSPRSIMGQKSASHESLCCSRFIFLMWLGRRRSNHGKNKILTRLYIDHLLGTSFSGCQLTPVIFYVMPLRTLGFHGMIHPQTAPLPTKSAKCGSIPSHGSPTKTHI